MWMVIEGGFRGYGYGIKSEQSVVVCDNQRCLLDAVNMWWLRVVVWVKKGICDVDGKSCREFKLLVVEGGNRNGFRVEEKGVEAG